MIDLHLHLDGAVSVSSTRQLAAMQGISIPKSEKELLRLIRVSPDCHDLNEFLEKFAFPCSLIMTPQGMEACVRNLLQELGEQGLAYAEIRFAPQLSVCPGMTQADAVAAAVKGMKDSPVAAKLILCCMRGTDTHEANMETVRLASVWKRRGVAAVDLAGAEALFPTADFEEEFRLARELGVTFTIHAGEADGPQSVWKALEMGACRIGHGIRAAEDPMLVKYLAEHRIPLEVCPTSNCQTCIFSNVDEMPVRNLLNAGVILTVNTDDPSIEGTDLKTEWRKLIKAFGLTDAEVLQLMLNSVDASFASATMKKRLAARIRKGYKSFIYG